MRMCLSFLILDSFEGQSPGLHHRQFGVVILFLHLMKHTQNASSHEFFFFCIMWKITGSQKREFQGQAVKSITRKRKKTATLPAELDSFSPLNFLASSSFFSSRISSSESGIYAHTKIEENKSGARHHTMIEGKSLKFITTGIKTNLVVICAFNRCDGAP
jgi:hypothetical protein